MGSRLSIEHIILENISSGMVKDGSFIDRFSTMTLLINKDSLLTEIKALVTPTTFKRKLIFDELVKKHSGATFYKGNKGIGKSMTYRIEKLSDSTQLFLGGSRVLRIDEHKRTFTTIKRNGKRIQHLIKEGTRYVLYTMVLEKYNETHRVTMIPDSLLV